MQVNPGISNLLGSFTKALDDMSRPGAPKDSPQDVGQSVPRDGAAGETKPTGSGPTSSNELPNDKTISAAQQKGETGEPAWRGSFVNMKA
ncbi:hypothetical protein [Fodinicurvata sediminis]|uniref:hypothetical protein n=1 Tax=Fodinicurvata sediminis TaxID=1121832 RepID=UPI0003B589B9|nr:hypothetical protein [Fodinicurvata sediminis]